MESISHSVSVDVKKYAWFNAYMACKWIGKRYIIGVIL